MSYQKKTHGVSIEVDPFFLNEGSHPEEEVFLWAYHIAITNQRPHPIQLCNRYWHITDASGYVHEVRGPGVVGEKPVILPSQTYEYASGVTLKTASGMMHGSYVMETGETKEQLVVDIPAFSLDSPFEKISLH
ncbi:MAG: Co2+/Mg2+ efflux protein ApaG [Alphaproteobacteria bacterium]